MGLWKIRRQWVVTPGKQTNTNIHIITSIFITDCICSHTHTHTHTHTHMLIAREFNIVKILFYFIVKITIF